MKPVDPREILDLTAYEKVRADFLRRMIEHKRPRRIGVGDNLTFIFEDRDTVIFQIQEMLRAERAVKEEKILDEIAVYNELVPGPNELSATLMIEIEDKAAIQLELDRFMGIDSGEHVWLQIGRDYAVPGRFEEGHSKDDKISAVHSVRFALPEDARRAFTREPVALVVEHGDYRVRTELGEETRRALLEDLRVVAAGGASR